MLAQRFNKGNITDCMHAILASRLLHAASAGNITKLDELIELEHVDVNVTDNV